jgi:4,5-dihydroxyphthalate decarboxylase
MDDQAIRLVIRDYDYLAPLYGGDVVPDGLNLIIDRKTPMAQAYGDPSVEASELSLSRFLIGLSNHDRPFVGIPFFPMRAFRHRCFFVRRDRTFPGLKQLEGMRVGTNGWPDTGNTWTRAALREQGILIERIRWWVGRVDEDYPESPQGALPPFARVAPRMLREMQSDHSSVS